VITGAIRSACVIGSMSTVDHMELSGGHRVGRLPTSPPQMSRLVNPGKLAGSPTWIGRLKNRDFRPPAFRCNGRRPPRPTFRRSNIGFLVNYQRSGDPQRYTDRGTPRRVRTWVWRSVRVGLKTSTSFPSL
jgi:hypothetical protein